MKKKIPTSVKFSKELFIDDMEKRRSSSDALLSILDGTYDWADRLDGIELRETVTGPIMKDRDMEIYTVSFYDHMEEKWVTRPVERRWLIWLE